MRNFKDVMCVYCYESKLSLNTICSSLSLSFDYFRMSKGSFFEECRIIIIRRREEAREWEPLIDQQITKPLIKCKQIWVKKKGNKEGRTKCLNGTTINNKA